MNSRRFVPKPEVQLRLLPWSCAAIAAMLISGISVAQDRSMSMMGQANLGTAPILVYQHPASAAGNLGLHLIARSRGGAAPLPLAGFTSIGLSRIDEQAILATSIAPLLPSGQSGLVLSIPNDTALFGYAFDAQALDVDFAAAQIQWASNDLELVIGCSGCDIPLVESFADESRMDRNASAGSWSNGFISTGVGGNALHGSFDYRQGALQPDGAYLFSTDSHVIPASQTLTGSALTVTDGKFQFSDFIVPEGVTVRFVGVAALQVTVRGLVDVRGQIDANGRDQVPFPCRNLQLSLPYTLVPGQPGTSGGPGAGRGGKGGDRCLGFGASPEHNGENGQDIRLGSAHGYFPRSFQTGGRGSPIHPAHGLDSQLLAPVNTYVTAGVFNGSVNYGGGGGGYMLAGGISANLPTVPPVIQLLPAAPTAGGVAYNPFPKLGPSSRAHFLVGGSGGGGGGSHPFLGLPTNIGTFNAERWKAGGGGTGGGGALAIRSGYEMRVGPNASIQARGGHGVRINGDNPATPSQENVAGVYIHWGIPAPGGGGSGGTILLQSYGSIDIAGRLDVGGGRGSYTEGILPNLGTSSLAIDNRGGDGSPGLYLLEAGASVQIGAQQHEPPFDPNRNLGSLNLQGDNDVLSGCRSTWRKHEFAGTPQWLRYVLELDTNGDGSVDTIYSDDVGYPGSSGPAADALGSVVIRFQGAQIGVDGNPIPGTETPWRYGMRATGSYSFPGLDADQRHAYRFDIVMRGNPFSRVKKLTVHVR